GLQVLRLQAGEERTGRNALPRAQEHVPGARADATGDSDLHGTSDVRGCAVLEPPASGRLRRPKRVTRCAGPCSAHAGLRSIRAGGTVPPAGAQIRSRKARWMRWVTGPGRPSAIGRPSTCTTGITSVVVPERKSSPA